MAPTAPPSEGLYEAALRRGQVRHAVKTALACCLAAALAYVFRLPSGQLAPVFAYLLLTLGMPTPRLNWLLALIGIAISAVASALILVTFRDAPFLYLAVTLSWIFVCVLFSNWFSLPATLAAMISALGLFVFFQGTVGAALYFFVAYWVNWLVGGAAVVVVQTFVWPLNTPSVFVRRLAMVYAHLEQECRGAARWIRSGQSPPEVVARSGDHATTREWAPFRPLRQLLAPGLRRGRDPVSPFGRMILACRSLNLRLWFFNRAIAPAAPADLPAEARQRLADLLDRCADQLHTLLEGALLKKQVEWVGAGATETDPLFAVRASPPAARDVLLAHGIHATILHRLVRDLRTATASHNALLASLGKGPATELAPARPIRIGARLLDENSVRSGVKLVVILLLLLVEEALLGFPGGSQVAFFATFFASTGNLGRQNKTDLVGLAGLLAGFLYGVAAAFLTSRLPSFALLLALVFLGEFLANLAHLRLPRFGAAGVQAGLALPFAFLATTGPEWGSFITVQTRFWGLVVAGGTAVVVHAFLWPVLPMRQLRASIADALRATAESLARLFASRSDWEGPPLGLNETLTRARDLLDDARYLPGPEHADPAYLGVLGGLQEIDANLEYVHFLLGLEEEHPLRQRFFQAIGDYAEQARTSLEQVARQFQPSPIRAARLESVRWKPDVAARWESASHDVGPVPDRRVDPWRPAVIARCLDQVARAIERISSIAREINLRNAAR